MDKSHNPKIVNTKLNSFPFAQVLIMGVILLTSSASWALGISSFRIYLDFDKRQQNFMMYNKDAYTQHCKLYLRYYIENDKGELEVYENDTLPENSAEPWLRFSPKSFSIAPAQAQSVAFQLRRRANTQPAEYRSHVTIDCDFDVEEYQQAIELNVANFVPKLRTNIPVVLRTGSIDVDVSFSNIVVNNGAVSFDLNRQGKRSIFGDIELIDTRSDKVIANIPQLSIYEIASKSYKLPTEGVPLNKLKLRFTENTEYGGNKIIEKKLQ